MKKGLTLRLSDQIREELKQASEELGVTQSTLAEQLLSEGLWRLKNKDKFLITHMAGVANAVENVSAKVRCGDKVILEDIKSIGEEVRKACQSLSL